jgi:molybdate transport system substrate-binding protein
MCLLPLLLPALGDNPPATQAAPAKAAADKAPPLRVLVGGTMRPAMEALIKEYTAKTGRKIEMDNGDSGELMIRIEQTKSGDMYVCHDPFLATLQRKGFCDKAWVVASLKPVIVVPKGNPKNIAGFRDLAKPGMNLILTDAVYSTMGHIVTRMAERANLTAAIESNTVSRTRGGGQAANAVVLGTADAAIVWDAVAFLRKDKLDAVPIEQAVAMRKDVDAVTSATYGKIDMDYVRVTAATLKFSKNLDAARAFAEFVASKDARKVWDAQGYSPVDDSRQPSVLKDAKVEGSILVLCAAGVREGVAAVVKAFEADTGVRVEMSFANSGQLLGQIETTRKGDVYVPGDVGFVAKAEAKKLTAGKAREFCYFTPCILVRKGNPKGIRDVADLVKPGLKLALADPSAAIGQLQAQVFRKNGLDEDALKKNTVTSPATVTDVAMAVKMGMADAAIVWDALRNFAPADAEGVIIPSNKNVVGAVPAVALAGTKNASAAGAFVDYLASDKGREILKSKGFSVDPPSVR